MKYRVPSFHVLKFMLFSYVLLTATTSFSAPKFGRYVGVLRHSQFAHDQLARLDFVAEQESAGVLKLRATLILYFGDFTSDEYASYDYDKVSYNLLTSQLVFDSAEREVHFVVQDFNSGVLNAELRNGAGIVGQLSLKQESFVEVTRPLIQTITGEYRGFCQGVGQRLQIQATPLHPLSTARSDPFAPYVIQGQFGENGARSCQQGSSTCITFYYEDADYDFFAGHIDFHGRSGGRACDVDSLGMTCGGCRFLRDPSVMSQPGIKWLPEEKPSWQVRGSKDSSVTGIQGVYNGYVHFEGRDVYQRMSMSLSTYRQPTGDGSGAENLMVSMVSRIYFGGHSGTDESITTKFDPRPFNIMNAQPIFDRADHSTDSIFKITKIANGNIEGIWFSRRFGRAGTILLSRDSEVELLAKDKMAPILSGKFSDGFWNIVMQVGVSDNAPSSKDPFSPLTIHGYLWIKDLTTRVQIVRSAYDPFTGKFVIETDNNRMIVGHRTRDGIRIKVPNGGVMRPMQPQKPITLMEVE